MNEVTVISRTLEFVVLQDNTTKERFIRPNDHDNIECDYCHEQTKFVNGFYDNKRGCIYSCQNVTCPVYQRMNTRKHSIVKLIEITTENRKNGICVADVATLRRNKRITMRKIAKAINIPADEYSDYEHERKAFPCDIYQTCMDYLQSI